MRPKCRVRARPSSSPTRPALFAARLDRARRLDGAPEQQQLFRQRGFAGVGVGDDRKGTAATHLGWQREFRPGRYRHRDDRTSPVSGGRRQLTPRSMTSKPPPSSSEATRFLPMSCKSPLTVPMATRPTGLSPRAMKQRADEFEGGLHGPGGDEQFGHEILVGLKAAADLVHRGDHVFVDQFERVNPVCQGLLGDSLGGFRVTAYHRFIEFFQIRHRSPFSSSCARWTSD